MSLRVYNFLNIYYYIIYVIIITGNRRPHGSRGVCPTNILFYYTSNGISTREAVRLPLTGSRSRTSRGRTGVQRRRRGSCLLGISDRRRGKTALIERREWGGSGGTDRRRGRASECGRRPESDCQRG